MATDAFAGPVVYLVFAFPAPADVGAGLSAVLERVASDAIEILDIEVITIGDDDAARVIDVAALQEVTELDLSAFEGVGSGVLDEEDVAAIAAELESGQFAIALVYEDRSLAQAASAWSAVGGVELFSGGVDIGELEHSLEGGEDA